jgi:Tfp pilus assembly protein PilO
VRGRSQVVLAVAGVVVLLVLIFVFFIRPRQGRLGEVRAEVQAAQDRGQQLEAELDRLRALQENAPELQATLNRFREFVPKEHDVSNFIFQVQDVADEAGVGFVQITPELPKQPPEGASLAEVRTVIGANGGYFAVQDFIRRLYTLDRAVRIDSLTMTGVDEQQAANSGRIDVQLTARVFFELPAGATAGTTAPTTGTAPAPAPAAPPPS